MPPRFLLPFAFCAALVYAQKYSGPLPSKPDVPYLVHADNLIETESAEAAEHANAKKKDEVTYSVPGAASRVKTPLASPILLIQTKELNADKLQLYKLESRNGNREITFSKKKNSAVPIGLTVNRVAEGIFRLEVNDSLAKGEYALTPEGSNQVFCFQID